jgi:WD40 repeat protein
MPAATSPVEPKFMAHSVQFTPSGDAVLVAGTFPNQGGQVRLDNLSNRSRQILRGHNRTVGAACLSPDGQRVVSAGDYWASQPELFVWDMQSGTSKALLGHSQSVTRIAYAPDGGCFATVGGQAGRPDLPGEAHLWNADGTIRAQLQGQTAMVVAVAFSPDCQHVATGGHDRTVRLSRVSDGGRAATYGNYPGRINVLAFSPDGKSIAAGIGQWDHEGCLLIRDVASGQVVVDKRRNEWINALAWMPDGTAIIVAGGPPAVVQRFDVTNGAWKDVLYEVKRYDDEGFAVAVSKDGSRIAVGVESKEPLYWDCTHMPFVRASSAFADEPPE